jgi:hypothetical protein
MLLHFNRYGSNRAAAPERNHYFCIAQMRAFREILSGFRIPPRVSDVPSARHPQHPGSWSRERQ